MPDRRDLAAADSRSADRPSARERRRGRAGGAGGASPPPPGVLYYCQDSKGFGHIRRTVSIADELARRRPDVPQLMATPSRHVLPFDPPPTLATLVLPEWEAAMSAGAVPHQRRSGWRASLTTIREATVLAAAEAFAPKVLLVDNHPTGVRVLEPTLRALRAADPRVELMLGLRDVVNDPAIVVPRWREQGIYRLLAETYDRILVYGSREIFDPTVEYEFPPEVAAKTVFCGYVKDFQAVTPPLAVRARHHVGEAPFVLVTVGAGEHGGDLIETAIAALGRPSLAGFGSLIVTGPRLPAADFARCEMAATALPGARVVRFVDDFQSLINAADVVVSAGGYNTMCEAIGFRRRTIVVPRMDNREPWIRATRFAARGLLTALDPTDLTADRLAAEMARALAAPPPTATLDFDGLKQVVDTLEAALGGAR